MTMFYNWDEPDYESEERYERERDEYLCDRADDIYEERELERLSL